MFDDDLYYVFDSHNRSSDGMCGDNTGTSVLLVFNTKSNLEEYLKIYYLKQFQKEIVDFEVQYIKTIISDNSLQIFKNKLRSLGYVEKENNALTVTNVGHQKNINLDRRSMKKPKRKTNAR